MVLGCWLDVPDITTVPSQLSGLQSIRHSLRVTNGTPSGVDEPGPLLEMFQQVGVDETLGSLVEGSVDCDNIALRDECFEIFHTASVDRLFGIFWQGLVVVVKELLWFKWKNPLKNP